MYLAKNWPEMVIKCPNYNFVLFSIGQTLSELPVITFSIKLKNYFVSKKMFLSFTVQINFSGDLNIFANSRPSASNFGFFFWSLKHFFLTVGQNNFWNKITFLITLLYFACISPNMLSPLGIMMWYA